MAHRIILILLTVPMLAFAQPAVLIGSQAGSPGETVTLSVDYLGTGSTVVGLQVTISYDAAQLTPDLSQCGGVISGAAMSCNGDTTGEIEIFGFQANLNEIQDGSLGQVAFLIDPAALAPQTLPVQLTSEVYSDAAANTLPANGSVDGQVQIVPAPVPLYASTPDPGSAILFTSTEIGQQADTQTLIVENTGTSNSVLTIGCLVQGADSDRFAFTAGNQFTLSQTSLANISVECLNDLPGMFTSSLQCSHNGGPGGEDETGLASYPLSCQVIEDSSNALFDSSPAPGVNIAFSTGPVLPGIPLSDQPLAVSNTAQTGANVLDLSCTLTGDSPITASPDLSTPVMIAPQDQLDISFSCDTTVPDSTAYTAQYSCSIGIDGDGQLNDGTLVYPITCDVTAALFEDGFEGE